jgi:predicted ABC-type ATPase
MSTILSRPIAKFSVRYSSRNLSDRVVLCFIGVSSPEQSIERVAMRVSQGEHDVPDEKLRARFPRTLANLKSAIHSLPHVRIYDNSELSNPFRLVAHFESAALRDLREPIPDWLISLDLGV